MFVSELACPRCEKSFPPREIANLCSCGSPLLVHYQADKVKNALNRSMLLHRPSTLWRYRELLPVRSDENVVSLGEGFTPLLEAPPFGLGALPQQDFN